MTNKELDTIALEIMRDMNRNYLVEEQYCIDFAHRFLERIKCEPVAWRRIVNQGEGVGFDWCYYRTRQEGIGEPLYTLPEITE